MKTLTLGYYSNGTFHVIKDFKEVTEPSYYAARLSKDGKPYLEVQISPFTASLIYKAQHS